MIQLTFNFRSIEGHNRLQLFNHFRFLKIKKKLAHSTTAHRLKTELNNKHFPAQRPSESVVLTSLTIIHNNLIVIRLIFEN